MLGPCYGDGRNARATLNAAGVYTGNTLRRFLVQAVQQYELKVNMVEGAAQDSMFAHYSSFSSMAGVIALC